MSHYLGKIPSTILFQDTLERRLAKKTKVRSHFYDICPNGCKLYQKNDENSLACNHCGSLRYSDLQTKRPSRQMKLMSIGDRIANFLENDKFRLLMKYRHTYEYEDGVFKDYFDGEEYKSLKNNTDFFSSEDDVALALFFDGFQPGNATAGDKLSIVHLINLNSPPEYRYALKKTFCKTVD